MRNPENISARRHTLLGDRPGSFAEAKYLRMSASKVRRVIDLVRGQDVITALAILRFAPQAAAVPARKTLQSAIANAQQQEGLEIEDLYVSAIFADEGVTLRRIRARAKGSSSRIFKRGAHLTVVVEPRGEEPAKIPAKPAAKAAAKSDAKPAAKSETKPAAKTTAKPAAKSETKPAAATRAKADKPDDDAKAAPKKAAPKAKPAKESDKTTDSDESTKEA